jgi:hypothetical protein
MRAGLVQGAERYAMLMDLYRRHAGSRVLALSGEEPVEVNAARVVAAVSSLLTVPVRRQVSEVKDDE